MSTILGGDVMFSLFYLPDIVCCCLFVLSCLVLSSLVVVLSSLGLSSHILDCLVLSWLVLSCLVLCLLGMQIHFLFISYDHQELTSPDSRRLTKSTVQTKRLSAALTSQIVYHDVHKTLLKYSTR